MVKQSGGSMGANQKVACRCAEFVQIFEPLG